MHNNQIYAQGNSTNAQTNQEVLLDRQLMVGLDVKRKDLKIKDHVKNANYKANGNKSNDNGNLYNQLGKPDSADLLLYREPTAHEQKIYDSGLTDPLEQLHRTMVLTYSSMSERDKNADKVTKLSGVSKVDKPLKIKPSVAFYPNEKNGYLGEEINRNDENHQWGTHVLRFPHAWSITKGHAWLSAIDGGLKDDYVGTDGKLGVNPDLRKNFRLHLSENFVDRPIFDNVGVRSGASESPLVHGMHVAGIMAAQADNATESISSWTAGGCPQCSFSMMNISNELNLVNAIVKAVDNGVQVINMSLETKPARHYYCDQPVPGYPLQEVVSNICLALTHAAQNGVSLIAAGGNHGNSTDNNNVANGTVIKHDPLYNLPAVHPDVMAISGLTISNNTNYTAGIGTGLFANSTSSGLRFWHGRMLLDGPGTKGIDWWGSNYGIINNGVPQISFAAPAQQIISLTAPGVPYISQSAYGADSACGDLANPEGSTTSDGIGYCTGNSMASAQIAAMAGLVKSANPLLDNAGVKDVLRRSAGCLDSAGNISDSPCNESSQYTINGVQDQAMKRLGYGIPKADKAVELALGGIGKRNRITPLFAHFQGVYDAAGNVTTRSHNHFYTTNPQMSIAAIRGTLLPAPRYKFSPASLNAPNTYACDSIKCDYFSSVNPPLAPSTIFVKEEVKLVMPDGVNCVINDSSCKGAVRFERIDVNPKIFSFGSLTVYDSGSLQYNGVVNTQLSSTAAIASIRLQAKTSATVPLAYISSDFSVPGYSNLPCGPYKILDAGTPCYYWHPKAVAMLMTTGIDTSNTGLTLKKLHRISCAPEDTCNQSPSSKKPYHVTFKYLTDENLMSFLTSGDGNQTFKVDGAEGFVYDAAGTRPAGTVLLCQSYNPAEADFALYTSDSACGGHLPPGRGSYTSENTLLGYVYPVQTPVSLPFADDAAADSDNDGIPNYLEIIEGRDPYVKDNALFAGMNANSNRWYVMQQYRDIFGREGDASGIAGWTQSLSSGTQTRAGLSKAFIESTEFQDNYAALIRLYFSFFKRTPDYGGLMYWSNNKRTWSTPLSVISQEFANSQEFNIIYGSITNAQFVDLCYQNVLGRAADSGGFNYWHSQLNSGAMTRGQVMLGFSESAEYKSSSANKVMASMAYVGLLRRTPDAAGFNSWLAYLNQGNSSLNLINGFIGSQEYRNRFLP